MLELFSLSQGAVIKITIPTGLEVSGVNASNEMACTLFVLSSSGSSPTIPSTCTYNSNDGGSRTVSFTASESYSSVVVMSLTIESLINLDSARFLSESFIVSVDGEVVSDHNEVVYSPDTLASASVSNEDGVAGQATKMTFTFRISNTILQGGKIAIVWPPQVQFKKTSSQAASLITVSVYGVQKTGFSVQVNQDPSRSILISGLFPDAPVSVESNDIIITVDQMNNPESQSTSDSFSITTYDASDNGIDQINTGITVTSTSPGLITKVTFEPTSYESDALVNINIYETSEISPTNAILRVFWPSEISFIEGDIVCEGTLGLTKPHPTCSVDMDARYMEIKYYSGTNHLYHIGTFRNPLGAMDITSWNFVVYDDSYNVIMHLLEGLTYTTTAVEIEESTVGRSETGTQVGEYGDYSISLVTASRMLSDTTIKFIFPYDQVGGFDWSTACYSGETNLGCTFTNINDTHFQAEMLQWCNSGGNCDGGFNINFTLKSAINPGWVVDPLTSYIIAYTINNQLSGSPVIDEMISTTAFSPSLTPGPLTDIVVSKDFIANKVGDQTSYTISFSVVTNITAGGQILYSFPSETVYKEEGLDPKCRDASYKTKDCTITLNDDNSIKSILITDACASG